MSEKDPLGKEAERRYSEHKRLNNLATRAILRSAKMDYRVRNAEWAHEQGQAGGTPERIKKAQSKATKATDQAGLAVDIVGLQAQRSGSWAAENHEQLVEAAKHSAQAAGVEIVTEQNHYANQA